MKRKVFGIGFHKTATSSLAAALYVLGYNVTGYFGVHDPNIGEKVYDLAFDLAERFDAAQDTPWPVLYKELDKRYPNSKFILTVRPSDRWIKSVTKHFKRQHIPAHEWIYDVRTAVGNEDVYIRRYERHNREVQEYFKDRPDDLLVMDITKGDGWEELCTFLGEAKPTFAFPAQNTLESKNRQFAKRVIRYLKRRLVPNIRSDQANQMSQGVSATFVRDIIHFHYSAFDTLWKSIDLLNEDQFTAIIGAYDVSVHDLISDQIAEEEHWLQKLMDPIVPERLEPVRGYQTKDNVYQRWHSVMLLMRHYVANLNDENCNSRIAANNAYIWEALVHIMNAGVKRRTEIHMFLKKHNIKAEPVSFIHFFRPE